MGNGCEEGRRLGIERMEWTDHRKGRETLCIVFEVEIEDVEKEEVYKSELQKGRIKHQVGCLARCVRQERESGQ